MKDGEGRDEIGGGEIGIEGAKLQRSEQTFIDQDARRERTEIEAEDCAGFDALAHKVELAFEIRAGILGFEKALADYGHRAERGGAEKSGRSGHDAPAETAQSGVRGGGFDGRA